MNQQADIQFWIGDRVIKNDPTNIAGPFLALMSTIENKVRTYNNIDIMLRKTRAYLLTVIYSFII